MLKQHEKLWENLLKTALLGTERQPPSFAAAVGPEADAVSTLIAGLDTGDREGALLSAAAALQLYERAGQRATGGDGALPEPCPPDDTPRCNARAASRLAILVQGENRALLPEWLAAAGAAGKRAPEELLPDLLEAGRRQSELRAGVTGVLGRRGRWLAGLNKSWSYVAGEAAATDEETWETGTKATRVALLRQLRGQDPARARELLAATWAQETPKDRSEYLDTLRIGLSMDDEPFLESALDDSRKETRTTAVELLTRLPESRLVQRMIERVRPLIKLSSERSIKKLFKKETNIEVTLPAAFDPAMARDGIEEKVQFGGPRKLGEKAWWMQQIVARIPPDFWSREWNMTPPEVIAALRTSEWPDMLIEGLRQSTQFHLTPEWIEAFLTETIERKQFAYDQLVQGLPPQRLEQFTLSALAAAQGRLSEVQHLVSLCSHAWSPAFARTILDAARTEVAANADSDKPQYHWLHSGLKEFGRRMPPTMLDEAATGWPADAPGWPYWRHAVDEMLALLQFRQDMLQELKID